MNTGPYVILKKSLFQAVCYVVARSRTFIVQQNVIDSVSPKVYGGDRSKHLTGCWGCLYCTYHRAAHIFPLKGTRGSGGNSTGTRGNIPDGQ